MRDQQELWGKDGQAGRDARDRAIQRVEDAADATFVVAFTEQVRHFAARGVPFTSADARDRLRWRRPHVKTHDDRAIGAVMKSLHKAGIIEPTGRYISQQRKRNHCRPLREWRGVAHPTPHILCLHY